MKLDVAAEVHARGLDDRLHAALDGCGHELCGDVLSLLRGHVSDRIAAHRPHLRELGEDRLVARHQVLVDERFAEFGSVDGTRDSLIFAPCGASSQNSLIEAITIDARRHATRTAIEMIQLRGIEGFSMAAPIGI